MGMRVPLRRDAYDTAAEMAAYARAHGDEHMQGLADRNLTLLHKIYAGMETALDSLNYGDVLTQETKRWVRQAEKLTN